jgi:hypothetical protein
VVIWYIFRCLVCCTKKNLATLLIPTKVHLEYRQFLSSCDRCHDCFNSFAKKWKNLALREKRIGLTLIFKKNANFSAEKRQKSPKIMIITLTPLAIILSFHERSEQT